MSIKGLGLTALFIHHFYFLKQLDYVTSAPLLSTVISFTTISDSIDSAITSTMYQLTGLFPVARGCTLQRWHDSNLRVVFN